MHLNNSNKCFSFDDVYPCPVCRLGQIKVLFLMDVMACELCRHMFTANLERQRLFRADRQPTRSWHWNGQTWIGGHAEGIKLDWIFWLSASAFVFFPPTLIQLLAYYLVSTPNTSEPWLPVVWTGLTFLFHLWIVVYAIIGFYQFSVGTYLRVMRQQWLSQKFH